MKSDLFLLLLNIQNRTHWCTFQIFNRDLVTWQDPDEIHSELSGNMRQYRVSISNVYLECGVGHRLNDSAFHFDHVGFCQSVDPSWS